MSQFTIGIDIGGTSVKAGLVSETGEVLANRNLRVAPFRVQTFEAFTEAMFELVRELLDGVPKDQVSGIGIGAPNGNYYTGVIEYAPNLAWKGVLPIRSAFEKEFDLPVQLTNDANASALGEKIYGAAKEYNDFIMITLGTGLGSGVVVNGQLVYGHDGFAGEMGHTTVERGGRLCGCGKKGCLEAYVSRGGIMKTYEELSGKKNVDLFPVHIAEMANNGDEIAIKTFEKTGDVLGFKLADAVNITSPKAFFFFGGIARAGELLFGPTRKALEENLLDIWKGKIELLPSALPENDAAILGAAALISQ